MKNKLSHNLLVVFSIILPVCLFLSGCENDEDTPEMAPESWLEHSYTGSLSVDYSNSYPEWLVAKSMDVEIDKELGTIIINSAKLNYSGETLVSDDSKIVRSGSWNLSPTGALSDNGEYLNVNAGITTENDIQQIYAKDNSGNWVLANETDFSGYTPNSDLSFSIDDAVNEGAIVMMDTGNGFIMWTLNLTQMPD